MAVSAAELEDRLAELAVRYDVPGAQVAVLHGGEVVDAAHGVLNVSTGAPASTDSLFQIGSISKVYTATLVMQLVDQGLLDLDEPLVTFLPEFAVADPDVSKQVTVRHLLAHTSGIDGDYVVDTGRGDDCLERYVAGLGDVRQTHPLGATFSYCNTGYMTLGRLIEVVTGRVWDTVLREQLAEPLGLTHTATLPEDVLRFSAALGHFTQPGQPPTPAPVWGLMRCGGPAGLICSRARDVVGFARMHLAGGLAPDGSRVLSRDAAHAMRQEQVPVPDRWSLGRVGWGLGWMLFDWPGGEVFGHDGGTIGQNGYLRVVPGAGVAVALLTNGGRTGELYRALYTDLLQELAGVDVPPAVAAPERPAQVDLEAFVGRYERASVTIDVAAGDGVLQLTQQATGPLAAANPTPRQEIVAVPVDAEENLFVAHSNGGDTWAPLVFYALPDGSSYLHSGFRSTPRVS